MLRGNFILDMIVCQIVVNEALPILGWLFYNDFSAREEGEVSSSSSRAKS